MDSNISMQLAQIIANLKFLSTLGDPLWKQPEFVGAALASIVALGIALFSEPLKRKWINTSLRAMDIVSKIQGGGSLIVYRLIIKNVGNHKAEDVEATVEKLYENGKGERNNFLPVPLGWTHAAAYVKSPVIRNIHPQQSVYLDLCEFISAQREGYGVIDAVIRLRAEAGQEIEDFSRIKKGDTELFIKLYQADGKALGIKVAINWDGRNPPQVKLNRR